MFLHVRAFFAQTKRAQRDLLNGGGARTCGGPADHPQSPRAGWRAAHGALEILVTSCYCHEWDNWPRHAIPVFGGPVRANPSTLARPARPIPRPSLRRMNEADMLAFRTVVFEIYRHFSVFVRTLPGNFIEFSRQNKINERDQKGIIKRLQELLTNPLLFRRDLRSNFVHL